MVGMYKYRKPLLIVASAMALIPIVYAAMAAVFTIVSGLHGVATCDEMSPFTMWTCSNFIWFAVRTALLSGMSYGLVRAFTSVQHWRRYWRSSYHGWWITYRVQLYLVKWRIRHGRPSRSQAFAAPISTPPDRLYLKRYYPSHRTSGKVYG